MNKFLSYKSKKFFLYCFISIVVSLIISAMYIFTPTTLKDFDDRLRDFAFVLRGEKPDSKNVVIVDIDEKSLSKIGQWPWSRDTLAQILVNLTNSEVSAIGLDIVFAEEDRTNPDTLLKKYNIKTDEDIPNYDDILAYVISQSPTILGYQFQMEDDEYINKNTPSIPVVFIERGKTQHNDLILNAKGTILNISKIQDNSYSSGFFNNVPDPSGVVRSVPMLIRYDDTLYPSLSLELVRALTGAKKVFVNFNELGVENIQIGEKIIPTDASARLLINFRGGEKSFKYISAIDILNENFKKEDVSGKIVLVGTSAAGLLDLRATPFESVYPGVEVHANAIDNILTGDFLQKPIWSDGANIFHIFLLCFIVVMILAYVKAIYLPIIMLFLTVIDFYGIYYLMFHETIVLNLFFPLLSIVVSSISALLIIYFFEKKNEEAIKRKFASKVSKEVMDSLLKDPNSNEFEAMDNEITIFFSDVRGFTNISEAMPSARALISFLNEYMTPMSEIIIKHKGTIDKYIGDAIMAYWNAPGNVENHQDKALCAAIEQIKYLKPLNENLAKKNLPLIDIGIGLNSGIATVGEMGSEKRSDYTCIGDPINLGSRLESLCKSYGARIIISEYVKNGLKGSYQIRDLDLVRVKGKTKPVEIFEVYAKEDGDKEIAQELKLSNAAVSLYRQSKFSEALEIFKTLEEKENKLNQKIYKIYIERCEHYISEPPS